MNAVTPTELKGSTALPQSVHSRLGPSSSHIWLNCAGSVNLRRKMKLPDDDGTIEAALGTVLHDISAEALLNDMEPWEFCGQTRKHGKFEFVIEGEHAQQVERNLAYVRNKFAEYAPMGAKLYVETRVHSDLDAEAYGTADIRIEVPGLCIIIIDFKYGMVRVNPNDSQLMEYGYMSYERRSPEMRGAGEPRIIELVIAQPRLPNPRDHFRSHSTTPKEIEAWFIGTVLTGMKATRDPNAPLTMGEHCKFCPGNTYAVCPAIYKELESVPVGAAPQSLTNDQIARIKTMWPVLEKFKLGCDNEALIRMRDRGESITGFKVVHKVGHRVWKEKVQLSDGMGGFKIVSKEEYAREKIGDAAFTKPALKSPAQVEEHPGGKAMASLFAYKPDTGLTVAGEDDPREPAVGLTQRAMAADAAAAALAVESF